MGPFEMVVAIVGIGAVASVARAKYGYGQGLRGWRGRSARRNSQQHLAETFGGDSDDLAQENRQLRDELHGLKERIQVLERLATDDESDARRLDREIEKLRERPGLTANKTTGE